MAFLTGALGFLVSFLMLRRTGGLGRHVGAFVLGMFVSLVLFGFWIAFQLAGRPIGGYRTEWLAGLWAFAIAVAVACQVLAMIVARAVRPKASETALKS